MLELAKVPARLMRRRRTGRASTRTAPAQPVPKLVALLAVLNDSGIRYCQWKSNIRLGRSLRGLTDLDLLVHAGDLPHFHRVLRQHDLKRVEPPPDHRYPGMEHHLGFDDSTGQLFHLHVHRELVLGEEHVKNHRLPLEAEFLRSTRVALGVRVPLPALEIVVLAVRVLLKTRPSHLARGLLPGRNGGVPDEFVREVKFLWEQTRPDDVARALRDSAPFLPERIVMGFLTRLVEGRLSAPDLLRLRARLVESLSAFQRESGWQAAGHFWKSAAVRQLAWPGTPFKKQSPASGGLTIALVGADGSGKSTQTEALRKWLSWKLETRTFYLGSKRPSWPVRAVGSLFRLAKRAHRAVIRAAGRSSGLASLSAQMVGMWLGVYSLAVGLERASRSEAGHRLASRGAIVIFDRYPLSALTGEALGLPMDGPQIEVRLPRDMGGWASALARWEKAIYARVRPVDRLIVLHVDAGVSLHRKPHRRPAVLEAKSRTLRELDPSGPAVAEVDANRPLEDVSLDLKRAVWGWL